MAISQNIHFHLSTNVHMYSVHRTRHIEYSLDKLEHSFSWTAYLWWCLIGLLGRAPRLILLLTGSYRRTLSSLVGVISSWIKAASCLAAISCIAAKPTFPNSFFSTPLPAPTTYLEFSLASFSWSSFILEGLDSQIFSVPSLGAGSLLRSRLVLSCFRISFVGNHNYHHIIQFLGN